MASARRPGSLRLWRGGKVSRIPSSIIALPDSRCENPAGNDGESARDLRLAPPCRLWSHGTVCCHRACRENRMLAPTAEAARPDILTDPTRLPLVRRPGGPTPQGPLRRDAHRQRFPLRTCVRQGQVLFRVLGEPTARARSSFASWRPARRRVLSCREPGIAPAICRAFPQRKGVSMCPESAFAPRGTSPTARGDRRFSEWDSSRAVFQAGQAAAGSPR